MGTGGGAASPGRWLSRAGWRSRQPTPAVRRTSLPAEPQGSTAAMGRVEGGDQQVFALLWQNLPQGGDRLGVGALHGAVAGMQKAAVGSVTLAVASGVGGLLRPALELTGWRACGLWPRLPRCRRRPAAGRPAPARWPRPPAGPWPGAGGPAGPAAGQRRGSSSHERLRTAILMLVDPGGLVQDLGDLRPELVVAAVGLVGGVAGQLGPSSSTVPTRPRSCRGRGESTAARTGRTPSSDPGGCRSPPRCGPA